jgi:carbonic anhydrase/acetyltransferase-like protein (isoleucine patch superfamily)
MDEYGHVTVCSGALIEGSPTVGYECILQPLSKVVDDNEGDGVATVLRDAVILEDKSVVRNSTIGARVLVGVGAVVDSSRVGDGCHIAAKACVLNNSCLGEGCIVGPLVVLDGVTLQDNMSVVLIDGEWQAQPCDPTFSQKGTQALHAALRDSSSHSCK